MPSIAERLKADPTGEVAVEIFTDRIIEAMEQAPGTTWTTIEPLLWWVCDTPNLPYPEAVEKALQALHAGDLEKIRTALELAGPNQRGREKKSVRPAVKAFMYFSYLPEYRRKSKGKSEPAWDKLAERFYPENEDSLRINVGKLRAQLEDCNVSFT